MSEPKIKKAMNFGKWKVSKNGDLSYDNHYHIVSKRLDEQDWILHLSEKTWIDFNDFIPAYFLALQNANIQTVTIKAFY